LTLQWEYITVDGSVPALKAEAKAPPYGTTSLNQKHQKEEAQEMKASRRTLIAATVVALVLGLTALPLSASGHIGTGSWMELQPGEQHWYTLSYPGSGQIDVGLDARPENSASFRIFTAEALRAWTSGAELKETGRGTSNRYAAHDLTWSGSFGTAGAYHLVVEYTAGSQASSFYSLNVSGAGISSDFAAEEEREAGVQEAQPAASSQTAATTEAAPAAASLATASAVSRLANQPGRAVVTARGNHFVIDSVPPLGGPNEEVNPLDLLLGSQATCAAFIYETAAQEMGIDLTDITATVEGDFNPAGVRDGSVNPRIQAMRVHMDIPGASEEQAEKLSGEFQKRCPMYTTLVRSAPIEITHGDKPEASVAEGLSTATAVAKVLNQPGRAIVTARGNHFIVDSVPPLDGPNEERNPLDLALGALSTCGTFIYETAAEEMGLELTSISAAVEGDFDARGVRDGSVNPRIQAFRVTMEVSGATAEQAESLSSEFQKRCPIYTTLSRSAPIAIENVTD
jgi:uncharacterized OsmC-like protein